MSIRLDTDGGVAVMTIDRREKLNALTLSMYDELGMAFAEVRDDPRIGVAVLTGAGDRAFCVGADLGESIPALTSERIDISECDAAHQKHSTLEKPVIAAINGLCLGGFEIMLSTDIRLAAAEAQFARYSSDWTASGRSRLASPTTRSSDSASRWPCGSNCSDVPCAEPARRICYSHSPRNPR